MPRLILRDDQFKRIEPMLPGKTSDCGVTAKDNRSFVEAVLWVVRTGSHRLAVARSPGGVWPVEQRIQALRALVGSWRVASGVR